MAEQKSLRQIIAERKQQYQESIQKTLNEVYESGDVVKIERFERAIDYLGRLSERDLEGVLQEQAEEEQRPQETEVPRRNQRDRRPRLTYYQYAKAKNEGLSNEDIKKKFRVKSRYQLGAFASCYKRYANKQNAAESSANGNRMNYTAVNPADIKQEAFARLSEFGDKEWLNSDEMRHVLGARSNSYQSFVAKYPEMQGCVEKRKEGGYRKVYFHKQGIIKIIEGRTPTPTGWTLPKPKKGETS